MSRQLTLLEGQLDLLELRLEADSDLLVRLTGFFDSFFGASHHAREELLLKLLAKRSPDMAAEFAVLASEHDASARELGELSTALDDLIAEPRRAAGRFHAIATSFLRNERLHMAREERHFFPAAARMLSLKDWKDVEMRFAGVAPANDTVTPARYHRMTPRSRSAA